MKKHIGHFAMALTIIIAFSGCAAYYYPERSGPRRPPYYEQRHYGYRHDNGHHGRGSRRDHDDHRSRHRDH